MILDACRVGAIGKETLGKVRAGSRSGVGRGRRGGWIESRGVGDGEEGTTEGEKKVQEEGGISQRSMMECLGGQHYRVD